MTYFIKGNTLLKKLLLLTLCSSVSLLAREEFTKIEFEGLTQISTRVALENINLKSKNSYSVQEINKAIKEFYRFDYFRDIWVTNENKVLTFHFKEKPFISNIEITGYKTREEEVELLYSQMNIKKGNMYTKQRVQNAKKALLAALEREGLVNSVVEVSVDEINENSVSVVFQVNKGDEITIKKIDYKGAQNLEASDFETVIANKEEDCCFTWFFGMNDGEMSYEQLEYDSARIRDLYLQNGYLDAKISKPFSKIDFNSNSANIEYTIEEGEQYTVNEIILFTDENIVKSEDLLSELKLEKGDIFNINQVRKDQEYIKTQIADKGYAFADVKFNISPDKEKKTVNIIYNVVPGDKVYINDVIISGNTRTLDRVIRRDVYLAPGDLFNLTDFKDSRNKLRRTGYFEKVELNQKRVSASKVDLEVTVVEAPTGNIIIGGGYGSYEGWMINGSINDKNVFGSGLGAGFSIDYSKVNREFSVSLKNPAIYDSKYDGQIKLYREKSEIINRSLDNEKELEEYGFLVGVGRSIGRHTRVGTTYELSDSTITYEDGTPKSAFLTSALTPYINYNNTDDYFLPREGISTGTNLKYAGIGGDARYMLSNTYFKFFYGLEDILDYDVIFRYKNNLKFLEDTGNIPDGETFYMGGPRSLRGFETYAFQPIDDSRPLTRYFSNTIELGFPLIPSAKMRWAIFYDYGMIGEDNFTDYQRSGAGVLFSWQSPVGPIQFIFAEALDAQEGEQTSSFEFNLGGQF